MNGLRYFSFPLGESSVHLATINGDLDSVKLLIEKGAHVNQAASGKFFQPEDQKIKRKKDTNYVGKVAGKVILFSDLINVRGNLK